jgi:putative glycosyltransferase
VLAGTPRAGKSHDEPSFEFKAAPPSIYRKIGRHQTMDLSIVTTSYYSAPYLEEFCLRSSAAAVKITDSFEIIIVNDGSPDDSLEVALSIFARNQRLRVIDLSRNFGHHQALMTGLAHSCGDLVFVIDSDLEEDPALLGTFHDKLTATGADVVFGVQDRRKGKPFERLSGWLFFKMFNALSSHALPANFITARLMKRRYVSSLLQHREREMLLAGLWALTGFNQIPLTVTKSSKGSSTYSVRLKIAHAVNAVTSFSNKPLVFIFYLGCAIFSISTLAAIYLVIRKIFFGTLLLGWPSLIVSIWMLGGITIFCLGIIGIYLAKIFIEVKQRPSSIVKDVYEHHGGQSAPPPKRAQEVNGATVSARSA